MNIFIEGYSYEGDAASVADLRDLHNISAPNVSVVIGQDWKYAESLEVVEHVQKFADIGTALGVCSAAEINQNIGDNEVFDIMDATKDAWMVPGLSDHTKNDIKIPILQTLENKGYIFGIEYNGLSGARFNNDHTCVEIIVDSEGNMNEHTIAYGRTHDKARRLLRTALLPKVKTKQTVDPETGKLPVGVVKYFENIGDDVLNGMEKRKEISFGRTTVDPNSDLLVAKELLASFEIVPYGQIGFIKGKSNLKIKI